MLVFILSSLPLFVLSYLSFFGDLTDPIKYIYSFTGYAGLIFLFISVILSIPYIKNIKNFIKYRRQIGLWGFFYAFMHLINFIVLDMELDLLFAFEETIDKPFIYLGMIAVIGLTYMSITSIPKLYKKYNKSHKIIYGILILILIHFSMSQKSLDYLDYSIILCIGLVLIFKIFKMIKKAFS